MHLGCVLLVRALVCRWAHRPGGNKRRILLASCAMNFTGTRRRPAAQVRRTSGKKPETLRQSSNVLKNRLHEESSVSVFGYMWRVCVLFFSESSVSHSGCLMKFTHHLAQSDWIPFQDHPVRITVMGLFLIRFWLKQMRGGRPGACSATLWISFGSYYDSYPEKWFW